MKNIIKLVLQTILGFKNYLFIFSIYKIKTLKSDNKEGDFFHFLALIPKNNSIILDIGANIGIMTYHLAANFSQSKIHAYEPIPQNFEILKRIAAKYSLKNVELYNEALGSENGKVEMVLPVISSVKMQGLSHVIHETIKEFNEGEKITAPCFKLDLKYNNQPISAIKIDVENFEFFVLLGGKEVLKKYHPIIYIELWDNENRQKCFDLLKQLSYEIKVVVNGQLTLFDAETHQKQNFICV